jgi:hypothetical protein
MSVVDVVTPELGLMEVLATLGARLEIVADSDPEPVPPSESVAVTVQIMVSPGELMEELRLRVGLSPKRVPLPLVQR